jgi:hypothetical protein
MGYVLGDDVIRNICQTRLNTDFREAGFGPDALHERDTTRGSAVCTAHDEGALLSLRQLNQHRERKRCNTLPAVLRENPNPHLREMLVFIGAER